jgi:hypothetical protein
MIKRATRQALVLMLGSIVVLCIVAEVVLVIMTHETSEALLAIASSATGALAGAMLPSAEGDIE